MIDKKDINVYVVCKKIREERKIKHLSIEKLAELCDINPSFLGHIECGERKLSVHTLDKICKAIKVSPDKLMAIEKNSKNKKLSWEDKISILISGQTEKNKTFLFKVLKYIYSNLKILL